MGEHREIKVCIRRNRLGNVIHTCGKARVEKLGVLIDLRTGEHIKIRVYPCCEDSIAKANKAAKESVEELKKMFPL